MPRYLVSYSDPEQYGAWSYLGKATIEDPDNDRAIEAALEPLGLYVPRGMDRVRKTPRGVLCIDQKEMLGYRLVVLLTPCAEDAPRKAPKRKARRA